ncbi:MAG: hypothetical protein ACN6OI_16030 [Flavobacterium sp.]|uniref:hypothetical protein n=1 Tax=Flavobacterium sp. TaxID=239 RepID=UPI003D14DD44
MFTIFSCTPDEYETQPKKKVEKSANLSIGGDGEDPDGPGDKNTPPPPGGR